MPIPDYETLMLPVLKLFEQGATNVAECLPHIRKQFDISDEEAEELIPSGRVTLLANRTHWARTYLSKAGLLVSLKRNSHMVTDLGRQVLSRHPGRIDNNYLKTFGGFKEWLELSKASVPSGEAGSYTTPVSDDGDTPENAMANANALLQAALRDELLGLLQQVSPTRFERLGFVDKA